jgi:C1A family cysteine protease
MRHKYGYLPDSPDPRDFTFRAVQKVEQLPTEVDLREYCSPVRDQGQLGSCTAFSMGSGLREFMLIKSNPVPPNPPDTCLTKLVQQSLIRKLFSLDYAVLSPLFLYYEERVLEGTVNEDSGASMRDGMKVLSNQGICPEVNWPYVISKFRTKPPDQAYENALNYKIAVYSRLYSLTDMKSALATEQGVVFGFNVYESFDTNEVAQTGNMPMPKYGERILGGHAVFICGYKDDETWPGGGYLIIKNSWGLDWGDNGYFYMPYAFASNPADVNDIWTASV